MTRQKIEERTRPSEQDVCRHHWLIEAARGPVSRGVCKICGTVKEFWNSFPEYSVVKKSVRVVELSEEPEEIEPEKEELEAAEPKLEELAELEEETEDLEQGEVKEAI